MEKSAPVARDVGHGAESIEGLCAANGAGDLIHAENGEVLRLHLLDEILVLGGVEEAHVAGLVLHEVNFVKAEVRAVLGGADLRDEKKSH